MIQEEVNLNTEENKEKILQEKVSALEKEKDDISKYVVSELTRSFTFSFSTANRLIFMYIKVLIISVLGPVFNECYPVRNFYAIFSLNTG